jgi:hypothetical protein
MLVSYRRICLILSWVGFTTIVVFINSYLNPSFNNESTSLFIALVCLIIAGFLFSSIVGINKRVKNIEAEYWKKEFTKENKVDIDSVVRQIRQQALEPPQLEPELIQFKDDMEKARLFWKTKTKSEYTPFDEFYSLKERISMIFLTSKVLSLIFSIATALIILNINSLPFYVFGGYAAIIIILLVILNYLASLSKKVKRIRQSISSGLLTKS